MIARAGTGKYEYSKNELVGLTVLMRRVANDVYTLFFKSNMGGQVHAFIEFCGVLNKYVDICRRAAESGIDFTQANTHSNIQLPVEVHDMEYLGEKLRCIFGPAIDHNPEAREALKRALFGEER